MNRITAITLFTLASLAAIGTASAQERAVRSAVPFNFTVGGKVLPAGTYTISQFASGTLEIENRETKVAVLSVAFSDSHDAGNGGKLVFNKYGDQYFLKEVLCRWNGMNVQLPPSKLEKKARMQEADLNQNRQILVAAK